MKAKQGEEQVNIRQMIIDFGRKLKKMANVTDVSITIWRADGSTNEYHAIRDKEDK